MKKMITLFIALFITGMAVNAQTDTSGIEYRYYPENNVYFNPQAKTYSWFDQSSAKWTTGIQLPAALRIKNEATFNTIRYPGTDIWASNPDHIKMYGTKNNPVMPKTSSPEKVKTPPPSQE